jgi:hypothetical protein
MSKKYKIGQFIGIVLGVIGGSILVRAIFKPNNTQYAEY